MPGNVRDHTFICDLYQLVGAGSFQMLPKVPDNLFVFLIEFNDHTGLPVNDGDDA